MDQETTQAHQRQDPQRRQWKTCHPTETLQTAKVRLKAENFKTSKNQGQKDRKGNSWLIITITKKAYHNQPILKKLGETNSSKSKNEWTTISKLMLEERDSQWLFSGYYPCCTKGSPVVRYSLKAWHWNALAIWFQADAIGGALTGWLRQTTSEVEGCTKGLQLCGFILD